MSKLDVLASVATRKRQFYLLSHAILCNKKNCDTENCSEMKKFVKSLFNDYHEKTCKEEKLCQHCQSNKFMRNVVVEHLMRVLKSNRQVCEGLRIAPRRLFQEIKKVVPENLQCTIDELEHKTLSKSMKIEEAIMRMRNMMNRDQYNRVRAVYLFELFGC